jgi:putative hydrolase of the HAD superfamily
MTRTEFVFFDIGVTLLHPRGAETYREVLGEHGYDIPLEEIRKVFHLEDKRFMREFPRTFGNPFYSPMPWFLGGVNYRLGVKIDLCAAAERWRELQARSRPYWVPFPETLQALEALKARGLGLGVISNWDGSARELLELHGLARFFDPILISSELGCEKPAAEIFRLALEGTGVPGERCLYVGDNYYDDAVGCRQVGMRPLIINRYGRLGIEEITDCPIITDLRQVLDQL